MPNNFKITLDGICLYAEGHTILENVSFSVESGTLLAITGPTGSGKSSLIRIIAGLQTVSKGVLTVNDKIVASEKIQVAPYKRRCGVVFQDLALWPHMTVQKHLDFVLENSDKESRESLIEKLLEEYSLADKKDFLPAKLSGGEQQRLAVARTLAWKPDILLLDEPFSSLDFNLKQEMIRLLKKTLSNRNLAVIYVSHSLNEILQLADMVCTLKDGKIDFFGSKSAFTKSHEEVVNDTIANFRMSL